MKKKIVKSNKVQNLVPTNIRPTGIQNSFLEIFKFKEFARNFVKTQGDEQQAYILTFGEGDAPAKIFNEANKILQRPEVQMEIKRFLPDDHELTRTIESALKATTPETIKWSEKHQYLETALRLKGYLHNEEEHKTQVNIGMVIKE